MTTNDIIVLHDVQGIARKSGTDQHGLTWVEFDVDYLAEQEDGTCSICGKTISSGWICLDGDDEACDDHIVIEEGGE
jgi:hypothetical protein